MKSLAHDAFIVTKIIRFLFEMLENIVGEGENTVYLLYQQRSRRAFFPGVVKTWVRV